MGFNKLTGDGGCQYMAGTHTGLRLYAMVINADAVLTTMTATSLDGTSTTINMLTNTAYNFSGATLKQGIFISAPDGYIITALTFSSGSAIGYKYTS